VLGKYVEKFLRPGKDLAAEPVALQAMSGLTDSFLAEHGYL